MQRFSLLLLLSTCVLFLWGCGGSSSSSGGTSVVNTPVTSGPLSLQPPVLLLTVGQTDAFQLTRDGAAVTATWTSDSPGIASVDDQGNVTGVSPGSAIITATVEGDTIAGYAVVSPQGQQLLVTPANPFFSGSEIGKTDPDFRAVLVFQNGNSADVTDQVSWSSSDNSVVFLRNTGQPDLAGLGTATLTATLANLTGQTTVTVGPTLGLTGGLHQFNLQGGLAPEALASGDFNGDGFLDLVTANSQSSDLTVLFGDGQGNLVPSSIPTAANPRFVISTDLNGDGKLDLVASNYSADAISILIGNGDGSFQPFVTRAVGPRPVGLAAGDVNGDGKLDLAVALSNANTVNILLGDGAGGFTAGAVLPTDANPRSLVLANLDLDDKLDLAVACSLNNSVLVFRGDGAGNFNLGPLVKTGMGLFYLTAADLDGDGLLELITANPGTNSVSVFPNQGGNFPIRRTFNSATFDVWVSAGDINGDLIPDLVVPGRSSNALSFLTGNGQANFDVTLADRPVGAGPSATVIADFNGDNLPDVASALFNGNAVSILFGGRQGPVQ